MDNKLYDMIDDILIKNQLERNLINFGTDSMIRYFVVQRTNKDSVSLKELERKYVKH